MVSSGTAAVRTICAPHPMQRIAPTLDPVGTPQCASIRPTRHLRNCSVVTLTLKAVGTIWAGKHGPFGTRVPRVYNLRQCRNQRADEKRRPLRVAARGLIRAPRARGAPDLGACLRLLLALEPLSISSEARWNSTASSIRASFVNRSLHSFAMRSQSTAY